HELQAARDAMRRYSAARNLFAEDYYLSAAYTPREDLHREVRKFLQDEARWIFHLHAPGGFGKTIFLRRLIARYAVPEPQQFPCARLDFDFINPGAVVLYPALLILPLAEQLNRQLPENPFDFLLPEARQTAIALRRAGVTDRAAPTAED